MNAVQLTAFRDIADAMIGRADWQWIGPHLSQRMFGITRERAEGYARSHGGIAQPMTPVEPVASQVDELVVICAWCPDFDPKDQRNANATHGICAKCAARF
jgi:hypothetical protein